MNRLCKYIESIDFEINKKIKNEENFNPMDLMIDGCLWDEMTYIKIKLYVENQMENFKKETKKIIIQKNSKSLESDCTNLSNKIDWFGTILKDELFKSYCSNENELTNYMIKLFFVDKKNWSQNLFWKFFGKNVYENFLRKNNYYISFPISKNDGDITFTKDLFAIYNINLRKEKESVI